MSKYTYNYSPMRERIEQRRAAAMDALAAVALGLIGAAVLFFGLSA